MTESPVTQDPPTDQGNPPDAQDNAVPEGNETGPHDILASPATNPFHNGTFCSSRSPFIPKWHADGDVPVDPDAQLVDG